MVYKDYRDGSVFSKGDPTVSRGGGGLGSIANSYNYRTFYFGVSRGRAAPIP